MIVICAHYTVFTAEEILEMRAIIDEISRRFGTDAVNTCEVRPTDNAPVLTLNDNQLIASPDSWGFPKWYGKGVEIHARSETALQKPMFSEAILTRRCVIPSTGFYEWSYMPEFEAQMSFLLIEDREKSPKTKLHFRQLNEPMLYMAGMMNTITGIDGNTKDVFIILTTAANASMKPFHDRMPVVLSRNECEDWISNNVFMREVLTRTGAELEWKIAG